jgi:uncharacterized protein YbjQ (UPF0145 family)
MPTVPPGHFLLPHGRPGKGDTGLVVLLPSADEADCRREILGIVRVRAPGDPDALLAKLRERAFALGGDRVVDLERQSLDDGTVRLSGMAARCSQLLLARNYVPVGRISVTAPAGEHQWALAEMAAKARALHAGLLVDVDYEEARYGGELRISAMAARYVPRWWAYGPYGGPGGPKVGAGPPETHRRKPPTKPSRVDCSDPTATDASGKGRQPGLHNCKVRF